MTRNGVGLTTVCKCCESTKAKDIFYYRSKFIPMCQECADLLADIDPENNIEPENKEINP